MNSLRGGYLKKRLLRIQVGFLLRAGPGASREMPLQFPQRVEIDADLYLDALIGQLIFTRTKEGILVQGRLQAAQTRECDRCLDTFAYAFEIDIAELFAAPPDPGKTVFSVESNGEIDLAPLLREETLIEASYRATCRADCRGLSAESGLNLNQTEESLAAETSSADSGAAVDPRLAVLKKLLR